MSKNKSTEHKVQSTENKVLSIKNRVQSPDSFESQLSASARRLRKQSEKNISTPATMVAPQKHTRYWGWIATPAAAVAGLLIGLFIHRPTEPQDNITVSVVATDNSGHSIVDDGTDYSLLISL